jgi:hypothetical protein
MASTLKSKLTFVIDDALTVDENIAAFANAAKAVDPQLANVLASALADFSNEVSVDQDGLLDALYAATAPAPKDGPDEVFKDEGAGQ